MRSFVIIYGHDAYEVFHTREIVKRVLRYRDCRESRPEEVLFNDLDVELQQKIRIRLLMMDEDQL